MKKFILSSLQIFIFLLGLALVGCSLILTVVYALALHSLWIVLAGLALVSIEILGIMAIENWLDIEIISAGIK